MRDAFELRIERVNTHQFIQADWVDIVLHTKRLITTGEDAGITDDGPDRPLQRFRLIPRAVSVFHGGIRNDMEGINTGDQAMASDFAFTLLGDWDAEMQVLDWWVNPLTGKEMQIRQVLDHNGYEQRGLIDVYDRRLRDGN